MAMEFAHPVVEPRQIVHQPRDLSLDDMRLLAHALILEERLEYLDRKHEQRRRDDDDSRAVGALQLSNPGKRGLLPVQVELPVGKGVASFAIPRLAPGAEHEELFAIPTHRRAVLTVGPINAVRGDPLGLLARVVSWTDPIDLYVHPRTVPMDGSSSGFHVNAAVNQRAAVRV